MRNPSLLLLIVVFILAPFKLSAAADTVVVRETRIPVLIERQDNSNRQKCAYDLRGDIL